MPNPAQSSGLKTTSGVIMARSGRLLGLNVIADGTNACNVVLYDNSSAASGTVLAKLSVKATDTGATLNLPDEGVDVLNGIYAAITGTGAACVVYFGPA